MNTYFMSLSSGSCGNCYYLGTSSYGILIDAGIGSRRIKLILQDAGIPLHQIVAVLITHDHADHIRSVEYLGEKLHIPVYTTAIIHNGINRSYCAKNGLYSDVHHINKDEPFRIRDFQITAFEVPHDATDNVGYHIGINNLAFTFITDSGTVTPSMVKYIRQCHYLIIEANYDNNMLKTGPYPYYLKQRIASSNGHLCNDETAQVLSDNYSEQLRHIWLCHISQDNNLPELAYRTVENRLKEKNIIVGNHVQLTVLKRNIPSELYLLTP